MHEQMIDALEELCETVILDLEKTNDKIRNAGGELTAGDIDYLNKLTHTIKSIKTTLAMVEHDGYSERGGSYNMGGSYARGGRSRNSYNRGSYARGRNARRDSMGRYSREGGYSRSADDMVEQLHDLMEDAPDEKSRQEIQKLISKMETM